VWQYGQDLVHQCRLQEGETFLDVGCGSGELTHALSQAAPNVIGWGMDYDAHMIQRARDQYTVPKENNHPSPLTFFQGDVRNFTLDAPVDVVFSNAALHWVPPQDAALAVECLSRALKDNGRLVVEFGGHGNVQQIVQTTCDVLGLDPTQASPWWYPSIAEVATLCEQYDLEVVQAHLYDRPTLLNEGEKGLRNWITMFGTHFFDAVATHDQDTDHRNREKWLDEIENRLRSTLFDGTQWTADYRRIRVIARKRPTSLQP
jgi:trans-aconitate methyltransferase